MLFKSDCKALHDNMVQISTELNNLQDLMSDFVKRVELHGIAKSLEEAHRKLDLLLEFVELARPKAKEKK